MVDWRRFRPIHKWLVIKGDPRVKKTKGGIILTEKMIGIERVMEGTGRILRVGNHKEIFETIGVDLEPGMRVCFRGFLKDVFQEFDRDIDDQPIFLLHATDVLALLDEDTSMGVFS